MEPLPSEPVVAAPRRAVLPVLLGGLVTTGLALGAVWLLDRSSADVNVMGWYANRVLPIGAILVGAVAGVGYGIASWMTGTKISRGLLVVVLLLQVLAYFVARYLEFWQVQQMIGRLTGHWVDPWSGFVRWFDYTTRSFAWIEHGKAGHPLGAWGYGIRFLEVAGFALGGVIVPAITKSLPYCDACGVYMRTKPFGLLPAGIPPRKIGKRDTEGQAAYQQECETALSAGLALLDQVREMAKEGRISEVRRVIDEHHPHQKEYGAQTCRIRWEISRCPLCHAGFLSAKAVTGQGNEENAHDLGSSPASPSLEYEVA